MSNTEYEVVKDAIHGYIKIFNHEKQIIDTPIFQRLRRISQNTGVEYVYPCATHTRFSHALGVMHIAGIFAEKLLEQIPHVSEKTKKRYYYLMRLWGLTHDIGQGPFSHLFDEVVLGPKHKTDHEKLGAKILRESNELPEKVKPEKDIEITMDDVAQLFEVKTVENWPLNNRIGRSDVKETIFYYVCRGPYSADIMDFLLRDSYFTGAGYGNIDWYRLIHTSIPFEDKILLDPRGEEAFDSLLLARLFMFYTVYYHRTTRAVIKVMSYFLKEASRKLNDFQDFIGNVDKYSILDENYLLFHPELKNSIYRKQLLERDIPYTRFIEKSEVISLDISDKDLAELKTKQTRENLPKKIQETLPEEAFFIDTPKIPLYPMFGEGEQYIFLIDPQSSSGYKARRIWETSWGSLRQQILLIRLFIHDDYRKYENEIIDAFTRSTQRTHY